MWIYESPFLLNLLYNTCVDANDLIKYAWREETSTQTDFLQVSDVFCLLHQSELYGQHDNTASSVTGTETNTMNLLADSFLLSFFYIFLYNSYVSVHAGTFECEKTTQARSFFRPFHLRVTVVIWWVLSKTQVRLVVAVKDIPVVGVHTRFTDTPLGHPHQLGSNSFSAALPDWSPLRDAVSTSTLNHWLRRNKRGLFLVAKSFCVDNVEPCFRPTLRPRAQRSAVSTQGGGVNAIRGRNNSPAMTSSN